MEQVFLQLEITAGVLELLDKKKYIETYSMFFHSQKRNIYNNCRIHCIQLKAEQGQKRLYPSILHAVGSSAVLCLNRTA